MLDFESIYRTYLKDVELYILALCKDIHLAEELTAECFFNAMKALPKFRGDCDIRTWLCAIGRNCYLSYLRKRRPQVSIQEIPDPIQSVEERIADKEQAMEVHRILRTLPESYREVFSLRVFAQLSFSDIGTLFGKSQNWACVTYHRARQKIQDELGVSR